MNKQLGLPLIVAVLLSMMLTVMYLETHAHNTTNHEQIIDMIRELKQANVELNDRLFEVRSGRAKHYTYLGDAQDSLSEQAEILLHGEKGVAQLHDGAIVSKTGEIEKTIADKISLVDQFKQKNAILRNSLDYYPGNSNEVKTLSSALGMKHEIENVQHMVMYFAMNNDPSWRIKALEQIQAMNNALRAKAPGQRAHNSKLENYLTHSKLIIDYTSELQTLANIEQIAPVGKTVDMLHRTYMEYYMAQRGVAEKYRKWMFILSAILVISIVYILFLLGRSAMVLARERNKAQVTLSSIGNGVIATDDKGLIEFINPVAEKLIGRLSSEVQGRELGEIIKVTDQNGNDSLQESVRCCLGREQDIVSGQQGWLADSDKNKIIVEFSVSSVKDADDRVSGTVIVIEDITNAHQMARKLEWQATHDALTGLVNRQEFENRLSESLILATQDVRIHTLLYLDLDQFKVVNDTCGHVAGDALLKEVVEVLKGELRNSDVFARLGGDEFGILLLYCDLQHARGVAQKILAAVQSFAFIWDSKIFYIGVSIGAATVSSENKGIAEILSAADMACYAAKDAGRNRMHVFEPNDQELLRRRGEMQWVIRITDAIREDRLILYHQNIVPVLYYQSMVAVDGDKGCGDHSEILLRLQSEDGVIIPPGAFIPAAERYNLMSTIDRWVITNTFKYYAGRAGLHTQDTLISINISGSSLGDKNMVEFIHNEIKEYSINPSHICFEITESEAVANLVQARTMINRLRVLGCRFALDDFGAGMSSFMYLKTLPVDYLKIDGKFVKDIVTDSVSRAMVEMINHVGHVMGLKTIAEFVENRDIITVLAEIGVDYAQGFGIHKPCVLPKYK